jgi:peroxiredoxin
LRTLLKPGEQVALWGISVDTAEQSRTFVGKIAADGRADPRYLKQRREGIPYPAAYVIDKAGRVAWSRIDFDFRERPPTSELRAALDALN